MWRSTFMPKIKVVGQMVQTDGHTHGGNGHTQKTKMECYQMLNVENVWNLNIVHSNLWLFKPMDSSQGTACREPHYNI